MKQIELYEVDDVLKYLNKIPFRAVSLIIDQNNQLKLVPTSSMFEKGKSFNDTRSEIKSMALGTDMYYLLDSAPIDAHKMRKKLQLSRTIVNIDDNNNCTIVDKRFYYFNSVLLTSEEKKLLKKVGIHFTSDIVKITPYTLIKLHNNGLDKYLDEKYISSYILNGNNLRRVSLEETLEAPTITYDKDYRYISPSKNSYPLETYFEYFPSIGEKTPTFGEPYELERKIIKGKIFWFASPKIIKNQNTIEYGLDLERKGNKAVVKLSNDDIEYVKSINMSERLIELSKLPNGLLQLSSAEKYIK